MRRLWGVLLVAGMGCGPRQEPVAAGCAEAVRAALPSLWSAWTVPQEEHAVWIALAEGLGGDALSEAYVRTWVRRMRMASEGTSIRPLGVDWGEVEVEGPGCGADATWTLRVALAHQGHRHPRVLRQRARVRLDRGRIVRMEPLDLDVVQAIVDDPFVEDAAVDGFLPGDELLEAGLLDAGEDG